MRTLENITTEVSTILQLDEDMVRQQDRVTTYAIARYVIMRLANLHNHKLAPIGKYLGGRDHSTIVRGLTTIEKALKGTNNVHSYAVRIKNKKMLDAWNMCSHLIPSIVPKYVSVKLNKKKMKVIVKYEIVDSNYLQYGMFESMDKMIPNLRIEDKQVPLGGVASNLHWLFIDMHRSTNEIKERFNLIEDVEYILFEIPKNKW